MAMSDYERERTRAWLRERRDETSQADLADDITRVTGWRITRDRYSKYESGSLPFGKSVLQHFVDYWTSKGQPGPDLTPPATPAEPVDPTTALASAITLLVDELRETRKERDEIRERLEAVEAAIRLLNAADDPTDATPPARVR